MALDGPRSKRLAISPQDAFDRRILRDHAPPREPAHEGLRVLEIRQLPLESFEPERPTIRHRQVQVLVVQQQTGGQLRQVDAESEPDPDPLAVRWTIYGRRPGLRSPECHQGQTPKARHDQFQMARGDGEERTPAVAVAAPDPLDEPRVRWPVLESHEHSAALGLR